MVSTRSGAAAKVGDRRRSTSPDFGIRTPRRASVTPRQAPFVPVAEVPPSSTKKSLSWGESPQWNEDFTISEGHYGEGAPLASVFFHGNARVQVKSSRLERSSTRIDHLQASLCSSNSRSLRASES